MAPSFSGSLASILIFGLLAYQKGVSMASNSSIAETNFTQLVETIAHQVEVSLKDEPHNNPQAYVCAEYEPATDTYWALKWADNFKEGNLTGWNIHQSCTRNTTHTLPCHNYQNVKLHSGLLLLSASTTPTGFHRHTGGSATSPLPFTFDRVSLRASLPSGGGQLPLNSGLMINNQQTAKRTLNSLPTDKRALFEEKRINGSRLLEIINGDLDLIDLANIDETSTVRHGLQVGGKADLRSYATQPSVAKFHVYEMKWNRSEVQFSLDGTVSRRISHRRRSSQYEVTLFNSVSETTVEAEAVDGDGDCSKLIVDYVRLYDRVTKKEAQGLPLCEFPKETPDSAIEAICPKPKNCLTGLAIGLLALVFLLSLIGTLSVVLLVLVKLGFFVRPVVRMSASYRRSEPIIDGEDKGER